MAAGTVAAVLASPVAGFAAEAGEGEAVDENLGEVVVTATRSEKREMDVPAAMTVVTAEDIHASGAQNAAEALARTDGFVYAAFGQNGAAMGTMANDATIRGVDNGTLVLVNGNPISWRGKYDLSAIPAATIDRIEVVKGAGSVLYGSEAMAGVINIITKKGASNQVTAGIGNSGQHHYGVNVGDDRLAVNYDFSQWKHGVDVSKTETTFGETKTVLRDVKKQSAGISYAITDHLDFLYQYLNTEATYNRLVTESSAAAPVGALFNGASTRRIATSRSSITRTSFGRLRCTSIPARWNRRDRRIIRRAGGDRRRPRTITIRGKRTSRMVSTLSAAGSWLGPMRSSPVRRSSASSSIASRRSRRRRTRRRNTRAITGRCSRSMSMALTQRTR